MKKSKNKVLPFPKPPEQPEVPTIVVQIGNEHFAIRWEIEELPPAAPLVLRTTCREKRAAMKIVKLSPPDRSLPCRSDLPFRTLRGTNVFTKGVVGPNMQMETKYLRLRTPVRLGSRFGDWQVCWLGGWAKHRLYYLVMG